MHCFDLRDSATPADYEFEKSKGTFVEQIIRPTGLLDPEIQVRSSKYQIEDLINEINSRINKKTRVLVTTLTKRMAEEVSKYLLKSSIKSKYLHSDVETLERIEIIYGLREGDFDVLVGVNLLREGLDLPEVSLVAILDADKEGFLRSERALTQTAGRAARNINGLVIMYADRVTESMKKTIIETERKRKKQIHHNKKHNISPKPIIKKIPSQLNDSLNPYSITHTKEMQLDMNKKDIKNMKQKIKFEMEEAAKNLDFNEAIKLRDRLLELEELSKKS